MSLHKHPELKEAVLRLPQKEKDKLLVRLIGKDKMLMKQLHFQLLEDQVDLADRIEGLKQQLSTLLSDSRNRVKNLPVFSSYKELHAVLRQASGLINEHEKITKDRFSEVECRLLILKEAFERYPRLFEGSALYSAQKLKEYTKGRVKTTINKYEKLHEDLQFDLRELADAVREFAEEKQLA
ncbi:hypothetical protein BC792_10117 [Sphingobacterium allocomposti]|uniref:Uncharacterized protein n=1 Tax=Sphingobacterium allocomposti TaxID=415956 RepID=A0A5S5DQX8_9SPHI|nr:hypothetical protein [Sphingobacterium composti Yoo et al. 2007 non Ten et al. 2007]TYP98363.1 hypothetical protein BC792_10117 [Sphingobacterium composti Yoo et al. 2007 non Ten et al. 2007]